MNRDSSSSSDSDSDSDFLDLKKITPQKSSQENVNAAPSSEKSRQRDDLSSSDDDSLASPTAVPNTQDAEEEEEKEEDQTAAESAVSVPKGGILKTAAEKSVHRLRLEDLTRGRKSVVLFRMPHDIRAYLQSGDTAVDISNDGKSGFLVDIPVQGADLFTWKNEKDVDGERVECISASRQDGKYYPLDGAMNRVPFAGVINVERRLKTPNEKGKTSPSKPVVPPMFLKPDSRSFWLGASKFCGGIGLEEVKRKVMDDTRVDMEAGSEEDEEGDDDAEEGRVEIPDLPDSAAEGDAQE